MKPARFAFLVALAACTPRISNVTAAPESVPGYRAPYADVYGACLTTVAGLRWTVTVAQQDAGLIVATVRPAVTTPTNFTIPAETVTIQLRSLSDSVVHVALSRVSATDQQRFYARLDSALKR